MESADQDISIPLIAPPHDETQPSEFSSGTDKEVEGGAPPCTSNTNSQQKSEVTALSLAMIIFFNASGEYLLTSSYGPGTHEMLIPSN